MSEMQIIDGLPFVNLQVTYKQSFTILLKVLVDTGSAGTILSFDKLAEIGLEIEAHDTIEIIKGVGGSELVITKTVDKIQIGDLFAEDFTIEVGAMDYGFDINGIIGMDFLLKNNAILDMDSLNIMKK